MVVVGGLESDKEPTVVSAAKGLFAKGGISVNFVTAGDHVVYIECFIRVIRKRYSETQMVESQTLRLLILMIQWLKL